MPMSSALWSGISNHKPPADMTYNSSTGSIEPRFTPHSQLGTTHWISTSTRKLKTNVVQKLTHLYCMKNVLSLHGTFFWKIVGFSSPKGAWWCEHRAVSTVKPHRETSCLPFTGLVSLGEPACRQITLSLSQSIHLQAQWCGVNAGHQWNVLLCDE